MSQNGKGSARRPVQITDKELQKRWEAAFGKKQTNTNNKDGK